MKGNSIRSKILFFIVLVACLSFSIPSVVHASVGWIEKNDSIYGSANGATAPSVGEEEEKGNVIQRHFSEILIDLGDFNRRIGSGGSNAGASISMLLEDIVYGRMSSGVSVTYSQFELEKGNPYGIIGAKVYVVFRQVVLSLFIILFVWDMVTNLVQGGSKGRSKLKDDVTAIITSFALLYFMPYIVDWMFYFRDVMMKKIVDQTSSTGGFTDVTSIIRDNAESKKTVGYALVYWIYTLSGIFFFFNYVSTALIQAVLFGAFPIICIMRTKAKRSFTVWAGTFFPNMFIPLIDSVLLLIPLQILQIGGGGSLASTVGNSMALGLIVLICIWTVVPARNAILRAFGGVTGVAPSAGFGGIMAAAMTASRMLGGRAGGGGSGSRSESISEMKEKKAIAEADAGSMDSAAERISRSLSDPDTLASEGGSIPSFGRGGSSGDDASFEVSRDDDVVDRFLDTGALPSESTSSVEVEGGTVEGVEVDASGGGVVESSVEQLPSAESYPELDALPSYYNPAMTLQDVDIDEANAGAAAAAGAAGSASATNSSYDRSSDAIQRVKEDAAFEAGLSENDQLRYNNLKQMDDIRGELAANEKASMRIAQSNKGLQRQLASIDSSGKEQGYLTQEQTMQRASIQRQLASNDATASAIQERNSQLQNNYNMRSEAERQFASLNQSANGGGFGSKTYSSANDMRNNKEMAQNRAKIANYRNFDSEQFRGTITPQQQAEFYQKRIRDAKIQRGVNTAATVVGVAAAATTAGATAFGGPGAMSMSGVVGMGAGHVAAKAGNAAVNVGMKATKVAQKGASQIKSGNVHSIGAATISAGAAPSAGTGGNGQGAGSMGSQGTNSPHPSTAYEDFKSNNERYNAERREAMRDENYAKYR